MMSANIPAYVYYIEHQPTGKFYYGSRYKHIHNKTQPEDDLWKKYFTSSNQVKNLRKEYGDDSFNYSVIFKSLDSDECFLVEQNMIKENLKNPLCLNMRYFDVEKSDRIFSVFGKTLSTKGKPKTESTKQKMRKPKSITHRKNISEAQKKNGGNGPAKHKEESKNKTRETMKLKPRGNKICPHCNKEGGFLSMSRWHFDNCKLKENNE
jgi:hypothetical protein